MGTQTLLKLKDKHIRELETKIDELEAENKKLKKENNSMTAAIYQIRQWTYVAFSGTPRLVKED